MGLARYHFLHTATMTSVIILALLFLCLSSSLRSLILHAIRQPFEHLPVPLHPRIIRMITQRLAQPPVPEHFCSCRNKLCLPRLTLRTNIIIINAWRPADRDWIVSTKNPLPLCLTAFTQVICELAAVLAIDHCDLRPVEPDFSDRQEFFVSAVSTSSNICAADFSEALASITFLFSSTAA